MNDLKRCPGCNNTYIWTYNTHKRKFSVGWCPECGTSFRIEGKGVIINIPNSVNRRKFYPLNEGTEENEYKLIISQYKGDDKDRGK